MKLIDKGYEIEEPETRCIVFKLEPIHFFKYGSWTLHLHTRPHYLENSLHTHSKSLLSNILTRVTSETCCSMQLYSKNTGVWHEREDRLIVKGHVHTYVRTWFCDINFVTAQVGLDGLCYQFFFPFILFHSMY